MDYDASRIGEIVEDEEQIDLPPGFRFHPTDEELISHYLRPKVLNTLFSAVAIGEVDLNKVEPWDLPCKLESYFLFNGFSYFIYFYLSVLLCSNHSIFTLFWWNREG